MKTHWVSYIEKELRDGAIDIEYDGFLRNLHPTQTLYVQVKMLNNTDTPTEKLVVLAPKSEKMIMSHQAGPCLENEIDFEIVRIYAYNPEKNSKP